MITQGDKQNGNIAYCVIEGDEINMRAKNVNVFLYAILLAFMMLCRTRPQASNFRIAFIKPKTGGLGFSFADFRGKIVVISIEKNSPVGNSGMVSVGNIILSIQGQDVAGMSAQGLATTIRAFPPGQRIIFHVQRHSLSSFARQQDSSELSNGEFYVTMKRGIRGYGIQMERRKGDKQIVVQRIIEGSSAYLCKCILPGDIIVKVNGEGTIGKLYTL